MDPQTKPDPHDELSQMSRKIEKLETEKQFQADEIRALKLETRSYQDELRSLNDKIQSLHQHAQQETFARQIGTQVRLRYLEQHRQRMGKSIGKLGYDRIKCGDRAAHRGRPVVDALLCLSGQMSDPDVYPDLYGVVPEVIDLLKDVPAIIEVTGFRASLQSEGRLTGAFQTLFERMHGVARTYAASPAELKAAFGKDQTLQRLQDELQICYDGIVAANPRGKPGFGIQQLNQLNCN